MRKYILIFLSSVLICIIVGAPLRGIVGFIYGSMIETPCYAIMTYIVLKKCSKANKETVWIAGLIILGRIILEFPLRIASFESTLLSLPNTLLACLTIILTALVFSTERIYIGILSLAVWGYCVFIGHKDLLEYMAWGPTPKVQVASLTVSASRGNTTLKAIGSDYMLLDFWNSKCGVCYSKFPELQSLYDKNKNKITIASIFVPFYKNEQESDGKPIIDRLGYTFPVWSVTKKDTLLKILKIHFYPTVILLDKNRYVIFRGDLENAEKKLEKLID